MKNLLNKYKNIFIVVVICIVVFILYKSFFAPNTETGTLLSSDNVSNSQSAVIGKDFLNVLLELRSIELDETIFSERAFVILRDFSQTVAPQPTGRPNPFADIGKDVEVTESPSVSNNESGQDTGEGSVEQ